MSGIAAGRCDERAMRATVAALAAVALLSVADVARAQGYPERTVEIVVPSTPGATADLLGRVLADGLTQALGQRFIVVNKAGASGVLGTAAVAQAKPDGYTLLHGAAFSLTVQPLLDPQARYDYKSFEPICQTFKNEQVIVAHPDGPFTSAQDLINAARAKPGALNYGHPGNATIPHLAMIEFARLAKVEFNQVPFKGPAEAIQMTHAGQLDFAAVPLSAAAASGLKMPALFAPARNPAIPDVPTMKEQGFDVAPLSFGAMVGPVGLPTDVKRKLGDACRAAAHADAYLRVTKNAFQPSDYYGDSATLASNLENDVAEKKRLLGMLGLLK
jgi:tripartite-type tricarboxylate transporter receptor subunit TctC